MGNLILKEQSVSGFTAAPLNKIKIAYGNDNNLYRIDDANNAVVIGGGSQTLAQTLNNGNTSGAYDILINTGQRIGLKDGDNTYTTYLSNNGSQAANRTVYLPLFDGQLAYHVTGVPLTTNYVLKGTTNGAITSSSLIYDNGTNVGIGTSSPSYKLHIYTTSASYQQLSTLQSTSNAAMVDLGIQTGTNGIYLGVKGNSVNAFPGYGSNSEGHLYNGIGVSGFNFVSADPVAYKFYNSTANGTTPVLSINDGRVGINCNNSAYVFQVNDRDTQLIKLFNINNTTGEIGISVASPTARLHVQGSTSAAGAYALKVDNSTPSALLYVMNDGIVGIGTASPSSKLHVVSTSGTAFRVDGSTTTNNFVVLDSGKVGISTSNPQALLEVSTQNLTGATVYFNVGYNLSNPIFRVESTDGNNSKVRSVVYGGNFEIELQSLAATNFNVRHNIYLDELNIGLSGNYNKTYHSGTAEQDGWLEQSYFGGTIIPTRKTTRTITFNNIGGTLVDRYEGLRIRKGTWTNTNAKFHPIIALDGNSGFGTTTPDDSAIVDFTSTTQGVLLPRMTTAQRTSISSPAIGLIVYQTDATEGLYIYKSSGWTFIA